VCARTNDAAGETTSITRYAKVSGTMSLVAISTYAYDGLGRLLNLTHDPAVGSDIAYTYSYDAASRMISMTNSAHADENILGLGYDSTDQLLSADRTGTNNDESYSYDANGNRTNTGYSTGTGNRLLCDGTYRYLYDNEGNRTAKYQGSAPSNNQVPSGATDITIYEWDYRNRLTAALHYAAYTDYTAGHYDNTSVWYTYDYLDRRILRKADSNGYLSGGLDYRYNIYQGENVALEIDDPDGLGGGVSPSVSHRYLYGAAVDEILAVEDGSGNVLWGLGDHEGTIRDIVNNSGTVTEHRTYDSFGKTTSAWAADFLFGSDGMPYDPATDTYVTDNSHLYDPTTGRWLSEDKVGLSVDTNPFRWCHNNPINERDPSGLCGQSNNSWPTSTTSLAFGGVSLAQREQAQWRQQAAADEEWFSGVTQRAQTIIDAARDRQYAALTGGLLSVAQHPALPSGGYGGSRSVCASDYGPSVLQGEQYYYDPPTPQEIENARACVEASNQPQGPTMQVPPVRTAWEQELANRRKAQQDIEWAFTPGNDSREAIRIRANCYTAAGSFASPFLPMPPSSDLHAVFGTLSCLPAVGVPYAVADSVVYYADKDYANGTAALVGAATNAYLSRGPYGGEGTNGLYGSLEEAAGLQARAEELNSLRAPWQARNGTTAVMRVRNGATGTQQTWIATEAQTMPKQWEGTLRRGEAFIAGPGHAEQTIVDSLGNDWSIVSGGSSRNVCLRPCARLLQLEGVDLGGPVFRGAPNKTSFRMFWRQE
jgi:RHS repeat-associated protein